MGVGAGSDPTTGGGGTAPRRPNSQAAPPDSSAGAPDGGGSCGTVKENRLTTGRVFERADSPIRAATAGQRSAAGGGSSSARAFVTTRRSSSSVVRQASHEARGPSNAGRSGPVTSPSRQSQGRSVHW